MYIRQTNSTNTLIRSCEDARPAQVEAAPEDTLYPSLLTLRAGYQTAGRGQQGNGWESEPQANLLFSTLIRPDAPDPGLSTGCALHFGYIQFHQATTDRNQGSPEWACSFDVLYVYADQ